MGGRPSVKITRNAAVSSGRLIGAWRVTRYTRRVTRYAKCHRDLAGGPTCRYVSRFGGQRIVDKAANRKGQSISIVTGFVIQVSFTYESFYFG
jgi:hypothetical protein